MKCGLLIKPAFIFFFRIFIFNRIKIESTALFDDFSNKIGKLKIYEQKKIILTTHKFAVLYRKAGVKLHPSCHLKG